FFRRSATPSTFPAPDRAISAQVAEAYGKLPLGFEPNQGQSDPAVKFLARGAGYNLLLAPTEAVIRMRHAECGTRNEKTSVLSSDSPNPQSTIRNPHSSVLRMKLVGANPAPRAEGLDPLPGKSNYFLGNDRRKWRANVPHYGKARYEKI